MRRTPGGDTGLAGEAEEPDLPGRAHVGAAAEFHRIADPHHPHDVAVLVGEERHGAQLQRLGQRHLADVGDVVGENQFVDTGFDIGQLRRVDRRVVREVEAQPAGLDQRPLLADVGAELIAQHLVHQVRGGVVALDVAPPGLVDRGDGTGAVARPLALETAGKHDALLVVAPRLRHLESPAVADHRPGVVDLAAAAGIERIVLEHHVGGAAALARVQDAGLGDRACRSRRTAAPPMAPRRSSWSASPIRR